MHWRKFPINDIPEDPKEFEQWLYARFVEKDEMLVNFYENGDFKGAKSVETTIGLRHWSEILDLWTPVAAITLLLNISTKVSNLVSHVSV